MSRSQGTDAGGRCFLAASLCEHPSRNHSHLPPPGCPCSREAPHMLAPRSQTPPFGSSQNLPERKMQKTLPKAGASHTLLYTVACARVFGWQLLFHPSGSIEKLNCTVWFWVLKGSWSIRQPHWCLSRESIASIETFGAIRIIPLRRKLAGAWQSPPDGKAEGQGYPTCLIGLS